MEKVTKVPQMNPSFRDDKKSKNKHQIQQTIRKIMNFNINTNLIAYDVPV